jgi:lysozyme
MTIQAFDIAIDVGDAQPKIDWAQVYASGIRIAMVKATEGAAFKSPTFDAQKAGALAVGLRVIPYHFMRPGDGNVQAQWFGVTAGLGKDQAYALDWEGRASSTAAPADVEAMGGCLENITGRFPLGYWGIPGSSPAVPTPAMQQWDRWIPRYPLYLAPEFDALSPSLQQSHRPQGCLFWQYTCTGKVPGIAGSVDRSVVYANTIEEALAWCDTGARPA